MFASRPTTRFLTALAIAAIASVIYATSAPGAQHAEGNATQLASLQRQVTVLQKQMTVLKRQEQGFRKRTTLLLGQVVDTVKWLEEALRDGDTCLAALTADEFQNTWSAVDRLAAGLGSPAYFGTQTAVDDRRACSGLGIPRPPLDPSTAPTVAPFRAFIAWLHGG